MIRHNPMVWLRVFAALFFLPLALLACVSEKTSMPTATPASIHTATPAPLPTATPAPMPTAAPMAEGAPAEIGVRYSHNLYTHCGVRYADFDGRKWLADPVLTSPGGANPPPGWGNPGDSGTMELVSKDRALFQSKSGKRAFFEPAPEDYPFKLCL